MTEQPSAASPDEVKSCLMRELYNWLFAWISIIKCANYERLRNKLSEISSNALKMHTLHLTTTYHALSLEFNAHLC